MPGQENKPLKQVPFYGLYGEPLVSSDPGFVHIENIADRSSDLGWVIKPHRHSKLFQVLCIFDGNMEVQINRENHQLEGSWIAIIPAGAVHGFRFQPQSQGFVLTIDATVLADEKATDTLSELESIQAAAQLIDANQQSEHIQHFNQCVDLIRTELKQLHPSRNQALAWLTKLAVLSLARQLHEQQISMLNVTADSRILNKFRSLLEVHYRDHWALSQYAKQLHVSTSTLSRLCHQYTGDSPKKIVQERLLTEAKRRLLYTRQTLEEIAYTLGFKDQAYFSRFFKKLEGLTPGNYRKVRA